MNMAPRRVSFVRVSPMHVALVRMSPVRVSGVEMHGCSVRRAAFAFKPREPRV